MPFPAMQTLLVSETGAAVDPGLALLQSATLWLNAGDPGVDSQKLANRGTGGTALDARFGSTTGVDTNDPLLLTHTGTNYLYLPGTASNNAATSDSVALSGATGLEIVMRVAPDVWGLTSPLISKMGSSGNYSWYLYTTVTSPTLRLLISGNGTAANVSISTVAVPFTDGEAGWIKATYRSSDRLVQFFTAADQATEPSSWTQLGTDITNTQTSINDSTAIVYVGSDNNAAHRAGKFYRAIIRDAPGGTTVFDADFTANSNQSSFTESSSNAATVTINRATSGRKSVMVVRPTLLFGTDDYLEIADNALLDIGASDNFTAVFVGRGWNTPASGGRLYSKKGSTSAGAGWEAFFTSSTFAITNRFADGAATSHTSTATPTAGQLFQSGWVRDVVGDTVNQYLGSTLSVSTSDTTTTSAAETNVLRIGSSVGSVYQDMEVMQFAVFRSALTSTQLGQIATYLGV